MYACLYAPMHAMARVDTCAEYTVMHTNHCTDYIWASVQLYLDIINLFLKILQVRCYTTQGT